MIVECCDICKQSMKDYKDKDGVYWGTISFREKKLKDKKCFMGDTWTSYYSICGHCRSNLAEIRKTQEQSQSVVTTGRNIKKYNKRQGGDAE